MVNSIVPLSHAMGEGKKGKNLDRIESKFYKLISIMNFLVIFRLKLPEIELGLLQHPRWSTL